jgi:hypothetical protein
LTGAALAARAFNSTSLERQQEEAEQQQQQQQQEQRQRAWQQASAARNY